MTVESEPMEVDAEEIPSEPLPPFGTVSILSIIKDAQQKHGLRHGDYQRYAGYCGRRIDRVRTSLKFKHVLKGKRKNAKFTLRPVALENITEERYFDIVLFETERCWAYAMALKLEAGEDLHSRKRFHKIRKLRKAIKYAHQLESVAKQCDRADASTKLEAQAYSAWIRASLAFESQNWVDALREFKAATLIYERLSTAAKISELYKNKCSELEPLMRFCEFNCGETEAAIAVSISEIMEMHLDYSEVSGHLAPPEEEKEQPIEETEEAPEEDEIMQVTKAPPPAQKPIFFDLALNHVGMPPRQISEEREKTEGKEEDAVPPPAPSTGQGFADKIKGWIWGN